MAKNDYLEYELTPQIDARKSFYGKARVTIVAGHKILVSNGTNVASIVRNRYGEEQAHIYDKEISAVSLRHIKEFFRQNGFIADNKQQMLKDYYKNEF